MKRLSHLALVVEDALLIPLAPSMPAFLSGHLGVDDNGRIAAIGPGESGREADRILDAKGRIVAPGFVSSHSHLFTSGLRGIASDQSLYGWGRAMAEHLTELDAESIYWLSLHGSFDVLNNGITSAYDFTHGRVPFAVGTDGLAVTTGDLRPQEYLEAQLVAKLDAGLRFVNSFHLDDELGTDEDVVARADEFVTFAQSFRERDELLGLAVTGAQQWSETPSTAQLEVAVMRRHRIMNQAHFLETPEHVEHQRSKFSFYERSGALGRDFVFGHLVQIDQEIVAAAAKHGCGVSWQPMANGRLGSGVTDVPAFLEAGLRVGVGVDDQACTDIADPFENMRVGIYLQRATRQSPLAMSVSTMLELHTMGSARVLGVADRVGSLEVGKYADFLVVDPRKPDVGPLYDPVASYVLACGLRNLQEVYVGGDLVAVGGEVLNGRSAEASRRVHARAGGR